MTKLEFTRDAERDLTDIYLYGVEKFGHIQAERYSEQLVSRLHLLSQHPVIGIDYSFIRRNVRRYEVPPYSVYYRQKQKHF